MRKSIWLLVMVTSAAWLTTSSAGAQTAADRPYLYHRTIVTKPLLPAGPPALYGRQGEYLGNLSANPYDPSSTSNLFGQHGSPYAPQGINNPYSAYGSPYTPDGVRNSYTFGGPTIHAQDGTYLGRLNANRYDPESVSNPYGRYGSPYSPTSINNPYSTYGSPYSTLSPSNPYLSSWDDD